MKTNLLRFFYAFNLPLWAFFESDDVLFSYKITGHYRYIPAKYSDARR
jgi:hypothetical protein